MMASAPPPLLEMRAVAKSFGGVHALKGVDFALQRGEIHALVGENGAGKSTLMKIIAGVHHDYEGTLALAGVPTRFRSPRDALASGIGMVHQELSIIPDLSVAENVFLGSQPVGRLGLVAWRQMAAEAKEHLAGFGLDLDPKMPAGELPIGLQQLVELARVLFSGARIVILDEPTSALSPPEIERLFAVLRQLKAQGTSFVFISHFLEDVLAIADRITVFRNGNLVATAAAAETDKKWLIERMIGAGHEELEATYSEAIVLASETESAPVLTVRGLTIPGACADLSFAVHPGEVLGIYGFMGSGQLELARALFGKLPLAAGEILIDGQPVRLRNTTDAKRAGIAYVAESRRRMLFPEQPVYRNLSIAMLEKIGKVWLRPARERQIAEGHIKTLGIRPPSVEALLRNLSGGNQQKVALGKWLTERPRLLVLAEPTRGMDVGAKDDVLKIVHDLRDQGIAILLVSTEPETVLAMANRVLVLRKGRIVQEFANQTIGKDHLLGAA